MSELEVLNDHYAKFIRMLFNTNLSAYFVQEGIITQDDLDVLANIKPKSEKSEFVLSKLHSALQVGLTASFYKILKIMKNYGDCSVKEFSTNIEQELSKKNKGLLYSYIANCFNVCTVSAKV